jgi:hypothetical protein
MEQNKTGRYLKYAIGEIVLVMVGILLALQVSNWNENRKQVVAINNVLLEIKEDLIKDKLALDIVIQKRTEDFEAQKRIITVLENKAEFNENVHSDLGHIILSRHFFSLSKGYNLLKELDLGSLNDKSLRILLTKYYERDIPSLLQDTEDDKFEFENYWLPYVRIHFNDWRFGSFAIPRDYSQLLNDQTLLTAIKINIRNLISTIGAYENALNTAKQLIELIDKKNSY